MHYFHSLKKVQYWKSVNYILPSDSLFWSLFLFNILPGLYIIAFTYKEELYKQISDQEYFNSALWYLISTVSFLLFFWLGRFFVSICYSRLRFRLNRYYILVYRASIAHVELDVFREQVLTRHRLHSVKIFRWMGWFGCMLVWIYFATGGYEKIMAYGSDMDSWAYRLIGFDDRNRFLIASIEVARRIILPFVFLYFYKLFKLSDHFHGIGYVIFILISLFVGAVLTLDRAPILLFFLLFIYIKFTEGIGKIKFIALGISTLIIVLMGGGLVTFLQYNIMDFSLVDILGTGVNFILHRIILVPSIASIELSFSIFPFEADKLFMQYSRLGALLGFDYIGTSEDLSIYVTPVGAIADIWRNFGLIGCIVVGFILGIYFSWVDYFIRRADPLVQVAGSFTAISLSFYFIFGVFFSQGVFFQLFFLMSVLWYSRRDCIVKCGGKKTQRLRHMNT